MAVGRKFLCDECISSAICIPHPKVSSPRTSKSFLTRVGFPLQDNSVWGMERYFTKWPRFLQQRIMKESHKECATFSDNTKEMLIVVFYRSLYTVNHLFIQFLILQTNCRNAKSIFFPNIVLATK